MFQPELIIWPDLTSGGGADRLGNNVFLAWLLMLMTVVWNIKGYK